jgi:ribonucleoside-diphosphate reductase alpha chain
MTALLKKLSAQQPIELQPASLDIWDKKYRLKDSQGENVDQTIHDTLQRVAKNLARVEITAELQKHWQTEFIWALEQGALPAGRILANAGAEAYKPATSTINCTVSGTIHDSMADILGKNLEAGLTLKAGCGIGYEFSTLRPKGAYVSGAGAYTSGPLSFMEIYDKMCFTVSSAGGRRGAQMATFDICHPDVMDFIRAKREDGCLRQFNLSLLITSNFMEAVKAETDWPLSFPISEKEASQADTSDTTKFLWRSFPTTDGYIANDQGLVLCRIYQTIKARRLWDLIMSSTYDFAEPGFILIDKVNQMNNNWFCENIRATNPCGEQPLPAYGSCLLGSINLTHFVDNPFTGSACFNWPRFNKVIAIFTRMLDNVVEINGLPLEGQRNDILRKRRHGMGFLGLGSTITMLGMKYGGTESCQFTEQVAKQLALTGWREGLALSKEKGPAPIMNEEFVISSEMLALRPEMATDGWQLGDTIQGKQLHVR